jgi:beta-alanine--pyruvate transaminase
MGHTDPKLHANPAAAPAAPSLAEFWMPFTPNRSFKADPKLFVRAEGMYYWTDHGDRVIDASSGMFCVNAGHGRREIADAVYRQLQELDFAPPFTRGHPKSFALAERVAQLTPGNLKRIFFVNSGSEAVDTALKLALAYHQARGQAGRTLFVSRERGYHGVNFGGVALAGLVNNRRRFTSALHVAHLRHTHIPENRFVRGEGETGADLADDLLRIVDLHGAENIAAVVVEPIAGSTGCLVPPKGYLERLRAICDAHGLLLIFDEVITGFGRTGAAFAADSFGVTPDLMTMAKGLTNAAQPMGAVAGATPIHDTVMNAAADGAIELFHGYTYSGHPAACAAGLAVLDIYEREQLFARAGILSPYFLDALWTLRDVGVVTDLRGYGLFAAIDVASDGVAGRRGYRLQQALFDNGLHLKTTGDSLLLAPPLIADESHVDMMVDILGRTLRTAA